MSVKKATRAINFTIDNMIKPYKVEFSYNKYHEFHNGIKSICKELIELGNHLTSIKLLKQKHVQKLVSYWQQKELSIGTIKNRLTMLRFVCDACGKRNVVLSNDDYNIGTRSLIPKSSKAIHHIDINKINDDHIKVSLQLQQAFGLRREECLKIIPSVADKGDHLFLQGSWTKGKVERIVPITTTAQRDALNSAKQFVTNGQSLIPTDKSYIHQRHCYDNSIKAAGYHNLHGLRHAYAQRRYLEMTGWESPINGGKTRKEMSAEEKTKDIQVRLAISNELGHSRIAITKIYLG